MIINEQISNYFMAEPSIPFVGGSVIYSDCNYCNIKPAALFLEFKCCHCSHHFD